MKMLISMALCLFTFAAQAAEYTVSLIGTETYANTQWEATGINDKGQIFGTCQVNLYSQSVSTIFLFDKKSNINFIRDEDYGWIYPVTVNNGSQIIGYGQRPFIWSKALGFHSLDIFNSINLQLTDLNDLGQIIGSYYVDAYGDPKILPYPPVQSSEERPFLWDNGIAKDMGWGSEFAQQIEALGYHVMGITLMSINNKGELAGCFHFGKYNEKQQRFVSAGYRTFFWDGDIHEISLPTSLQYQPYRMQLNNRGVVLLRTDNESYLWSLEKGLQPLVGFNGDKLNDSSVVLGYKNDISGGVPAIWREGNVTTIADLLGVENIYNMAPPYSDNYAIERLDSIVDLNNNGQIVCNGWLWGERHPCLLEPIKKTP